MTLFLVPQWIIELGSRRIIHVAVPRHPTDVCLAKQLRAATTPFRQAPHYLIHDQANNYGETFARVTVASDITHLKMPYRAKANANYERFMGSLRQECLNQILILGSPYLQHIVVDYATYFNRARSHKGSVSAFLIPTVFRL